MTLALATAHRFAAFLDKDDFAGAASLLAAGCTYDTGKERLVGPEAILGSYRTNAEAARRLERIDYTSEVSQGPDGAAILFIDRITQRGKTHVFQSRQHVQVAADGRITAIRHEELPGERERLRDFFSSVGVQW